MRYFLIVIIQVVDEGGDSFSFRFLNKQGSLTRTDERDRPGIKGLPGRFGVR
ncbi:MAG: hypothetical protein ACQES4_08355 [Bacillota bacterium]